MFPVSSLDHILEIEKTPLSAQEIASDPYSLLKTSADKFADRDALIMVSDASLPENAIAISYRTLFERVTQYANLFAGFGVGQPDVVSYLLPNTPETHYVIWGAQAAGIVNPINPYLEAPAIAAILRAAKTKVLVCPGPSMDQGTWEKVSHALEDCPDIGIILTLERDEHQKAPTLHDRICNNIVSAAAASPSDGLRFPHNTYPEKISAYFCTGGTTGTPKLAQLTSFNQTFVGWVLHKMMQGKPNDRYFCGLPLFHINAVVATGILPFTSGGCAVLLTPSGFRNRDIVANFWNLVDHFQPTTFSGVPTVYSALLQNAPGKGRPSCLKYGICGAAPLPASLKQSFQDKTGIRIVEGYGMTEGTCVTSLNLSEDPDLSASVGCRIPYQMVQTGSFSPTGELVQISGPDQPGVLAIKGPNVFKGYVNARDNAGQFTNDGWFITGDLASVSDSGFLYLNGRSKDVIIRGGHNIDPLAIEGALSKHPDVQLVAALGSPDTYAGELPVAYVQLQPRRESTEEDLLEFAKKVVSERAAVPVKITILTEMPTTSVGKIFKPKLRELAAEAVVTNLLKDAGIPATVKASANKIFAHGLQIAVEACAEHHEQIEELLTALPVSLDIRPAA